MARNRVKFSQNLWWNRSKESSTLNTARRVLKEQGKPEYDVKTYLDIVTSWKMKQIFYRRSSISRKLSRNNLFSSVISNPWHACPWHHSGTKLPAVSPWIWVNELLFVAWSHRANYKAQTRRNPNLRLIQKYSKRSKHELGMAYMNHT